MPLDPDPTHRQDLDVLIIGAGIAGLAAATALRRIAGGAVSIIEQAAAIAEVGAGLQISPNGTRVLRALGINPLDAGDHAEAVELRDARGRLVTRMNLPPEPGFFLCHRADLISALEGAMRAAGGRVQLLQRAERIELQEGRARVITPLGVRHSASLVIGADGLQSRLRAALNDPAPPFFTGQVAWRALIAGDGGAPVAQVFMGPGRHLVSYPLRGGRMRNIVAVEERSDWAAEGWNHRDDPANLRNAFADFGGPVPEWLASVDELYLWGLFRHPVAARWHDGQGRAALIGDAAHPTLPFMAQGANMALEDAWTLASSLTAAPGQIAQALARYQRQRATRTRAIVEAANRNARAYHLRPPLAAVAHGVLRLSDRFAPGLALRRFGWIHDHDATAPG